MLNWFSFFQYRTGEEIPEPPSPQPDLNLEVPTYMLEEAGLCQYYSTADQKRHASDYLNIISQGLEPPIMEWEMKYFNVIFFSFVCVSYDPTFFSLCSKTVKKYPSRQTTTGNALAPLTGYLEMNESFVFHAFE